jgi:hypothetical protein
MQGQYLDWAMTACFRTVFKSLICHVTTTGYTAGDAVIAAKKNEGEVLSKHIGNNQHLFKTEINAPAPSNIKT